MRHGLRAWLAVVLAAQVACVPNITERCRLVTNPTPPPALPAGFAELDELLLRRATDVTLASRHLDGSLVIVFRRDFAEVLLPVLCERMEKARALAMAGRTVEAGRKYQALLVTTQVLAYAVAVHATAQYADRRLQAGGQISHVQERFAGEAVPILEAALSEDPRKIERALAAHPEVFASWATLLEEWPAQVDDAAHRAKVAMVVWNIAFLAVAMYQAVGAAAGMMAAGRPPMPPLPAFATAGGATAASYTGPAALELVEALRKLIALGALDAGVVVALSRPLGGAAAPSPPVIPSASQMSAGSRGGEPPRSATGKGQPAQGGPAAGTGARLKAFNEDNFRENLGRLTGGIRENAHAHHVFPQKFAKEFRRAGINVNDPRFGAWWEANAHQRAARAYNKRWERFWESNQNATVEQILQFGREISRGYGLTIHF